MKIVEISALELFLVGQYKEKNQLRHPKQQNEDILSDMKSSLDWSLRASESHTLDISSQLVVLLCTELVAAGVSVKTLAISGQFSHERLTSRSNRFHPITLQVQPPLLTRWIASLGVCLRPN